jgi:hypothetical protein
MSRELYGVFDTEPWEAGKMCFHQLVVCLFKGGHDGSISSWANGVNRLSSLGYIGQVDINLPGNTTSMPGTSCLDLLARRCLPKSRPPIDSGEII